MITRPYIKPISTNFEEMLKELPKPMVILELWKDTKPFDIINCSILAQEIDSSLTDQKGICVVNFILKSESGLFPPLKVNTTRMFMRCWEFGTHLIEENELPHYDFVAVPIDIEYKILNIYNNQNHIYVVGELVGI